MQQAQRSTPTMRTLTCHCYCHGTMSARRTTNGETSKALRAGKVNRWILSLACPTPSRREVGLHPVALEDQVHLRGKYSKYPLLSYAYLTLSVCPPRQLHRQRSQQERNLRRRYHMTVSKRRCSVSSVSLWCLLHDNVFLGEGEYAVYHKFLVFLAIENNFAMSSSHCALCRYRSGQASEPCAPNTISIPLNDRNPAANKNRTMQSSMWPSETNLNALRLQFTI